MWCVLIQASANVKRPRATMEEHVKMSKTELSGAIAGLGTKERTAKQVKLKRLAQIYSCLGGVTDDLLGK